MKIEESKKKAHFLTNEAHKLIDQGNRLMEKGNFQHQIIDAMTRELATDMAEDSGPDAYQDSSDDEWAQEVLSLGLRDNIPNKLEPTWLLSPQAVMAHS